MHTLFQQTDGWTFEGVADESDVPNKQPITLEKELQGCIFSKETRKHNGYLCEIRYEEQLHNQLIIVEAIVFGDCEEITENDVKFFRRGVFDGDTCKRDAAVHGIYLKGVIDGKYLLEGQ